MSANNPTGRWYIWAISSFLFICIIFGGTLLVLYMTQPESPTTSWYPIVGIGLVCLPWFFWFLTCFYRILSRTFGFRMVCWGTDAYPVDSVHVEGGGNTGLEEGNDTSTRNNEANSHAQSSRQVHFGGAMVVNEEGDGMSSQGGGNSPDRHSHESETPLRLSMAS